MNMPGRSYHRFWAKTVRGGDPADVHLVPYHCLDVAAVFCALVDEVPAWRLSLERVCGQTWADVRPWMAWLVALHDAGKFAPGFQHLSKETVAVLQPELPWAPYGIRHDSLGLGWFNRRVTTKNTVWHIAQRWPRDAQRWLEEVAPATFWHHGKPGVEPNGNPACELAWGRGVSPAGVDAANEFAEDAWGLLAEDQANAASIAAVPRGRRKACTWLLAGLTNLADWIGSSTEWFPYAASVMDLGTYWDERAVPQARRAVAEAGVGHVSVSRRGGGGFATLFPGLTPRPAQRVANDVTLGQGPVLAIIEDQTGNGKTEAALTLAHRIASGGAGEQGVHFALPTMATSNAMFGRSVAWVERFFEAGAAQTALTHSRRNDNEDFQRITSATGVGGGSRSAESDTYGSVPSPGNGLERTASAECSAWMADDRRRSLLAHVAVGTVDQAMMAALPIRFQSLRLLGLVRTVVIIDEVHAYDEYMNAVICALLAFLRMHGASVVLLSATLPAVMRARLVAAWGGAGKPVLDEGGAGGAATPYPLLTLVADEGSDRATRRELQIEPTVERAVTWRVGHLHDPDGALDVVRTAVSAGRCVCWIRNTVGEAREAYEAVTSELPGTGVTLFHSRFTRSDRHRIESDVLRRFGAQSGKSERHGQVLIATQVVEQSLDVDFDVLISDLCPIDLLLQRGGRYRRHKRSSDGDRVVDGEDRRGDDGFYVYGPRWEPEPDANWYQAALPGASFVYADHALLWRTREALELRANRLSLPRDSRALVEHAYSDGGHVPSGLQRRADEARGRDMADRAQAAWRVLEPAGGYGGYGHALEAWATDEHEDRRVPTRLGESALTVRLVVLYGRERLVPLGGDDGRARWGDSDVAIAESQLRAVLDELYRAADGLLCELGVSCPDKCRFALPVLMQSDGAGRWRSVSAEGAVHYSERSGLYVVQAGAST